MVQRALVHGIEASHSSVTSFLHKHFANRSDDLVDCVLNDVKLLNMLNDTKLLNEHFANVSSDLAHRVLLELKQKVNTLAAEAVPQAILPIMEKLQEGFQAALVSQQNANKESLQSAQKHSSNMLTAQLGEMAAQRGTFEKVVGQMTEEAAAQRGEMTAQRGTFEKVVGQMVGEVAAQRGTFERVAGEMIGEMAAQRGEVAAQRGTFENVTGQLVGEVAAQREEVAAQRVSRDRELGRMHAFLAQQQAQQMGHTNQQIGLSAANRILESPGGQRTSVAPHVAGSAPPLPGFQSPAAASTTHSFAPHTAGSAPGFQSPVPAGTVHSFPPRAAGSVPGFQPGQHVWYCRSGSHDQIRAMIVKVYKDDTGGPPYYEIKYLNPQDIPQEVEGQERVNWTKQTVGDKLSLM